ncbi:MAG: hypothetical protein BroJett030_03760 [Alphaproteobacteria bacterium]|nr:MAG: hypothetical protein BroJett030_03760 [Alphaproteobacteria bacterium]
MLGQYAAYIVPAYAVSAAVIAGLTAWTLLQYRRRLREIATLEEKGVRRRAATRKGDG